jgi:hypothetical protein
MLRKVLAGSAVAAALALRAAPALACGALVAPDGAVRLAHVATFVAWHDGVERYLTSFAYQGSEANLGWVVPLPAAPTSIQAGGRWTLQRLELEANPPAALDARSGFAASAAIAAPAQVIEQTQIEALEITVIKGSGPAVLEWASSKGFFLSKDVHDHLLTYAKATPFFMAAKYDLAAARARGLLQGDGVPLLITMRIPHLWVPLEILANDNAPVNADLFLLSDQSLKTGTEPLVGVLDSAVGRRLPSAPGLAVKLQEPMNDRLFEDLSRDRNMAWVWRNSWITYLQLQAPAEDVTYDLGVASDSTIRLAAYGTPPMAVASDPAQPPFTASRPWFNGNGALAVSSVVVLPLALALGTIWLRRHRRPDGDVLVGALREPHTTASID